MKTMLGYLWKLPLCGIVFFIGMALSGGLLPALGFEAPAMPAGTDANTIALWFLLGSLILAFSLSFISQRLNLGFWARWFWLALLTWVVAAVGMVLEAWFFMDTGAVSSGNASLFTILNFVLPSLAVSGMVALLFKPLQAVEPEQTGLGQFLRQFPASAWLWRLGAALLAYPLAYFAFGLLVLPFIEGYYAAGQYELVAPTWGQLIPLQLARSALFLLVSLPILIHWRGTRAGLWLALGTNLFVLTAFMAVITSYWFPWQMRLFHGLELLADGLVYAAALVLLLTKPAPRQ